VTTETPTLAAALAAFQAERPRVVKDATNTHFRNTYATLDAFEAAVLPALGRHGLAWTCLPTFTDDGVLVLRGRLLHARSGEALECVWPLGGGGPQALGSAVTYGRRYCLGAVVGVSADEDDDGNAATGAHESSRARRSGPAQPEPDPWAAPAPAPVRERASAPTSASSAQLGKLGALMRERGLTDRTEALAVVVDVVGRPITSRSELTKAEASAVIDHLSKNPARDPWAENGDTQ
jgi:hypothetical protein